MILAIDIGNSNIVLGCINNEDISFVARISTDISKTEDQYAIEIIDILQLYHTQINQIDGSIISSVVPILSGNISSAVLKITGKKPLIVEPGIKTGLNIKIDDPAQLGADMVVTAVAAIAEKKLPSIIIDMGTATTISAISKDGAFLGGAILPGVIISLEALSKKAALLTGISLEEPKSGVIGTNTIDCMASGIVYGNAGMIDGIVDRMKATFDTEPYIVATGGLAKFIIPHCKNDIEYDGNLMLKGLRIIYNKNKI
ncbi:Type III pantothenate kinase [bioreactor metagenome]|uniref:Type III pantothenate kinase n=1 Tax=bioreactor metagenome TaxID=1076179 RepID=A0A645DDB7_9ZZZZ